MMNKKEQRDVVFGLLSSPSLDYTEVANNEFISLYSVGVNLVLVPAKYGKIKCKRKR